jgi:hypothetical protein
MATFTSGTTADRDALKTRTHGYEDRAPYREALGSLADGEVLKITPDESESARKVKLALARAAKEIGATIKYAENVDGDIVVWAVPADQMPVKRRARKSADESEDATVAV